MAALGVGARSITGDGNGVYPFSRYEERENLKQHARPSRPSFISTVHSRDESFSYSLQNLRKYRHEAATNSCFGSTE